MKNGQPPQSDSELVSQARRGDAAAFHQLVDRHGAALYGLACRLVGNPADAEDVMQEMLAGAFRGLGAFRQQSSVKTWLTRILVRQAARHQRDAARYRLKLHDRAPAARLSEQKRADVRMDLDEAIAALSHEHREVIVLRELQGLSYEQIASVLNLPPGTVESRLFRARRELRELLKEYRR